MKLPILYHKGKNGEMRVWSVWTEGSTIKTEYGVLNGEMVQSSKVATGKNIGRKNETSPEQQAEAEAQSLWTFKKERKYSESKEDACEPLLLPMLAKEYEAKKVSWPAFVQPKLDGVRCLAFWSGDTVKLISRAGKEWTVASHIAKQLENFLPKDSMFDGELYVHGFSCQTITSWVKKLRDETLKIQYHIYDMPIVNGRDDLTCHKRILELTGLFEVWMDEATYNEVEGSEDLTLGVIGDIRLVDTKFINSEEAVRNEEKMLVQDGYEGAIVRNLHGIYQWGYRSSDLLKVKTFKDAEFEVIGCRDGIGKFVGHAVWICKNDINDLAFECTCAVPMEERARMYREYRKYIGRKLTVKFFERTDDGLPRFPVGKLFRDEKDLG